MPRHKFIADHSIGTDVLLKESQEKYHALFNKMDQGYCIIQMLYDTNGEANDWRFVEVNPAFEKHNGLTDATGKTIRELSPDIETKWIKIYNLVAETGESIRFEEDSNALGRVFDLYAFPIGEKKDRKVAVLFTDITSRRKSESDLRQSEARTREALILRDNFIALVSHELKTPLTSMMIYAELAKKGLEKAGDKANLHQLSRLYDQIKRLKQLVSHLLDAEMIAEGGLKLNLQHFMVDVLIKERLDIVRQTCKHRFLVELKPIPPVYGDSDRIDQVVTNLLSNAIKFSENTSTITVSCQRQQDFIKVGIKDEGCGIAEEHQSKIFDRFYRVGGKIMDTYPGTGLGLYISAEIIHRHRGQISVESKVGHGSTFNFLLPIT